MVQTWWPITGVIRSNSDLSDISQAFEVGDIFTRMDAISGLKSSPWEGLGKLVKIPLDSSIFAGRYHNLQYWFSDSIYIAVSTGGQ